jgi:hypothetical protein
VARTNQAILAALRKKLGDVSHQAISQRRHRIQSEVGMPTDIATYVIAQREGVRIEKHLDTETLRTVAEFQSRLDSKGAPPEPRPRRGAARNQGAVVKELHVGGVKIPDAALGQKHSEDAVRMAEIYPVLYAFENSMREFIDGHLSNAYGSKWHEDPKLTTKGMRERVERNRSVEGAYRYHSRRTDRFIYYTDLGDLPKMVQSASGWKVFKALLPTAIWLELRVEAIEVSRNVVAHMNPLSKRDMDRIRMHFREWLDQIKGRGP